MSKQRPHRSLISDLLRREAAEVRAAAARGEDAPTGEYANGLDDAADIIDRILAPLTSPAEAGRRADTWREVASWIRHNCTHQFGAPVCADCLHLTSRIEAFADQIAAATSAPPTT